MSLKQRIIDKAIEAEKKKILQQLEKDPGEAFAIILSRCGIQFEKDGDGFLIPLSSAQ